MTKQNFKFRGFNNKTFKPVQIDTLSYEPLSQRIKRFLSGDVSSLDGENVLNEDYDENEKIGNDYLEAGFEDIDSLDGDVLNQPLDKLDLEEIRCDNDKAIINYQKRIKDNNPSSDNNPLPDNTPSPDNNPSSDNNSSPDKNKEV